SQRAERAAHVLLVDLRELAADRDLAVLAERPREIGERRRDTIGRLVEDQRCDLGAQRAEQRLARTGLARRKAEEREAFRRYPRTDERRERGIGPRHDLEPRAR